MEKHKYKHVLDLNLNCMPNNKDKYMTEAINLSLSLDSEEKQIEAVRQNGLLIKYIFTPTLSDEVKLVAVKQNGWVIQFIPNPTEEMYLEAIKQNSYSIQYIDNPTYEMQLEALKRDSFGHRNVFKLNDKIKEYIKNKIKYY